MMKITERYLSILPHVCVPWDQVSSLYGSSLPDNQVVLTVSLLSQHEVKLPSMPFESIEKIFEAFQLFQEKKEHARIRIRQIPLNLDPTSNLGPSLGLHLPNSLMPGQTSFLNAIEQLSSNLKHNPQMSELPPLPAELLEKIAQTAKELYSDLDASTELELPQPQEACRCLHCQIARAIQEGSQSVPQDPPLSPDSLQWHVHAITADEYFVSNPQNSSDCHKVYLKPKISCTCQQEGCAHIEAVLRS